MKFYIRPALGDDAEYIWAIRTREGVFENIMTMPSETLEYNIGRLSGTDRDLHQYCAVTDDGRVIGTAGVSQGEWRQRHVGLIGIMVDEPYQSQGVGTALMDKIIDTADNWLMLTRLELTVFCDNERAIALYKKYGFEIEGTLRKAAVKNGVYADMYIMSRIRE